MASRTVAAFLAYKEMEGTDGIPLIAKGAPGDVYLAAADGTKTATTVQVLRKVDRAVTTAVSNIHGMVAGFGCNVPADRPGVWFTSGNVECYQPFIEGQQGEPGLPGMNAVPADEAVGSYLGTEGTTARAAVAALLAGELVKLPTTRVDAKSEGATGDGSTDDHAALQAGIDKAQSLGKEFYVPAGEYRITEPLRMKRDTLRMVLEPSARVFATNETRLFANGAVGQTIRGWNNVYIEGGVWDLSEHISWGSAFTIGAMRNLTLRDLTIKGITNSHGMELAGCDQVLVDNVTAAGFNDSTVGATRGQAEFIQIERINSNAFPGFAIEEQTPTTNIVIRRLRQDAPPAGFGPWPCMVGSHAVSATTYLPMDNITVEDSDLGTCSYFSIRATTWTNTRLSRVTATCTGEAVFLLQGQGEGTYDWSVDNCTLTGAQHGLLIVSGIGAKLTGNTISCPGGRVFFIAGTSRDIQIQGNKGTGGSFLAIAGRGSSTAVVSGVDVGGTNLFVPDTGSTSYIAILSGTISDVKVVGLTGSVNIHAFRLQSGTITGIQILNNTIRSASPGVHYLVSSPAAATRVAIAGNVTDEGMQVTDLPVESHQANANMAIL